MSLRRETIHRMTRRCLGWDYRQPAIYMITLVQADRRRPLLGRLVVDGTSSPEEVRAHVETTALGEAILEHWKRMGEFTPEIKPLFCQIMPDHLHAILEVRRPMDRPLGNAIGGFKTGCEKLYRKLALPAQDKFRGPAAPSRPSRLALHVRREAHDPPRCARAQPPLPVACRPRGGRDTLSGARALGTGQGCSRGRLFCPRNASSGVHPWKMT